MKTDTEFSKLSDLLRREYNQMSDEGMIAISPAILAERVYHIIDPSAVSPELVQVAANLELRQRDQ